MCVVCVLCVCLCVGRVVLGGDVYVSADADICRYIYILLCTYLSLTSTDIHMRACGVYIRVCKCAYMRA